MSIAFAQGAVALRSAGTGTGFVRLSAVNILYRFGRFLQYSGSHVNPAVVTLQRAAKNRLYRKLVPLGSGTRRADLEQTHGFMRTLILGKSIENRNFYAMRALRTSGRARQTHVDTFNMLRTYVSRVPKISHPHLAHRLASRGIAATSSYFAGWTRQLNAAFKVKFICESLAECPATSWDSEAGRWSSGFEAKDIIEKIQTTLNIRWGFPSDPRIFHNYIRALNCINHDPAYHSTAQEGILAPFIDDIE
jgi:hypothetical protein